jgi:predicted DNA-binding transcriptional regulator AlpA
MMATKTTWWLPKVLRQPGLSRSIIYEMIGRGDFSRQVQLSRRAVGWITDDIIEWFRAKVDSHAADSLRDTV